jgi:uncharacterized protein (DUF2062 family)
VIKRPLRRFLPHATSVPATRLPQLLGPLLRQPELWHINRRGIALGLAVGLFMGLLVPVAQIPFAALLAILVRANLPVAVASTLVTNPVTFGPIYYAAYRLGTYLLGGSPDAATETILPWGEHFLTIGKPLLVGLATLAAGSALTGYLAVSGIWRLHASLVWRRRRLRRETGSST